MIYGRVNGMICLPNVAIFTLPSCGHVVTKWSSRDIRPTVTSSFMYRIDYVKLLCIPYLYKVRMLSHPELGFCAHFYLEILDTNRQKFNPATPNLHLFLRLRSTTIEEKGSIASGFLLHTPNTQLPFCLPLL